MATGHSPRQRSTLRGISALLLLILLLSLSAPLPAFSAGSGTGLGSGHSIGRVASVDVGRAPLEYVRLVRTIEVAERGILRPAGLAFSPSDGRLLLLDARSTPTGTQSRVSHLGLREERVVSTAPIDAPAADLPNATVDPSTGELLILDETTAGRLGVHHPKGIAFDPSGRAFVLVTANGASRVVRILPDATRQGRDALVAGQATALALGPVARADIRGIAFNPEDGHLYLYGLRGDVLFELTATGRLVSRRDLGEAGLHDPGGMVFAPSGDPTDDPAQQSLYVLDRTGSVVELSMTAPVLVSAVTASPDMHAELVRVIESFAWTPNSPDPGGLAFQASTGQLLVADSEVDEMPPYFTGVNVFRSATGGSLLGTYSTMAYSNEPSGVAVNAAKGHVFFSGDNGDVVFEIDPGPDGQLGGGDDTRTSFSTAAFNSFDSEGLAFGLGSLWIADGVGAEIYRVSSGLNGVFDGVPPAGDDTVASFDTASLGQLDPEGLEFNPDTGNLYIVSNDSSADLAEVTTSGSLVRVIDLSPANGLAPSGLALAPGSANPSVMHLYLSDRVADNGADPLENDGRIYELALVNGPAPNLLANPSFEYDYDFNNLPDGYTSSSRFMRDSAIAHSGTYAGRHFATDGSAYTISQTVEGLMAGVTYQVTGWVNIPPTSDLFSFKLYVKWLDAANTTIGAVTVKKYSAQTDGWNEASATNLLAPAGTTNARIQMIVTSLNATIYVDDFGFRQPSAGNNPPDAVDDTASVNQNSGATTIDVLSNDSDADGDALTVSSVTQGAKGSVAINGGGTSVVYTPNLNATGADSFSYTIGDGNGGTDTATVSITIIAEPTPTPTTVATPEPTATPEPNPTPEPTPTATAAPTPTPTPTPEPTPTGEPTPGPNLAPNGGFEFDANADGAPDGWTVKPQFTRSGTVVRSGAFAGRHEATDRVTYTIVGSLGSVPAGSTLAFDGWVDIPQPLGPGTKFQLKLEWRAADNTVIGNVTVKKYSAQTAGWDQAHGQFVAPAGTATARVLMSVTALVGIVYVDDFDVRRL